MKFKNKNGDYLEFDDSEAILCILFGPLAFIFRGMVQHFIGWFLICVVTFGIANIALVFILNRQTIAYYRSRGYQLMPNAHND